MLRAASKPSPSPYTHQVPKLYTPSLLICLALGVGSAASFIAQASAQAPVSPAGSPASDAPGDVTGTLARPELATVRVELERLADGLAADGLPAVMIEEKAAEGLSKRVPAPLIASTAAALERLSQEGEDADLGYVLVRGRKPA